MREDNHGFRKKRTMLSLDSIAAFVGDRRYRLIHSCRPPVAKSVVSERLKDLWLQRAIRKPTPLGTDTRTRTIIKVIARSRYGTQGAKLDIQPQQISRGIAGAALDFLRAGRLSNTK
jgi:hypothetical protein